MIKPKRKTILERQQGVIGTARWLAAMASKAHDTGHDKVLVSVQDIREVTGFISALESIELHNSANTYIGWVRGEQVNEMKSGLVKDAKVIHRKNDLYDTQVFAVSLPKKVVLDDDAIPMDAPVEITSLAEVAE